MRKFFYATAALSVLLATLMAASAADEPPYARPVAPSVYLPPPFSWTGFYIGPNLGGAWSQRNLTDTLLGLSLSNANDKGAFIGGGQLGYNYQFGNFVLGIEADFDGVASTNSPGSGERKGSTPHETAALRVVKGVRARLRRAMDARQRAYGGNPGPGLLGSPALPAK